MIHFESVEVGYVQWTVYEVCRISCQVKSMSDLSGDVAWLFNQKRHFGVAAPKPGTLEILSQGHPCWSWSDVGGGENIVFLMFFVRNTMLRRLCAPSLFTSVLQPIFSILTRFTEMASKPVSFEKLWEVLRNCWFWSVTNDVKPQALRLRPKFLEFLAPELLADRDFVLAAATWMLDHGRWWYIIYEHLLYRCSIGWYVYVCVFFITCSSLFLPITKKYHTFRCWKLASPGGRWHEVTWRTQVKGNWEILELLPQHFSNDREAAEKQTSFCSCLNLNQVLV